VLTVKTYDENAGWVEAEMWSVQEVADMLVVSPDTIRRLARDGVALAYRTARGAHFTAHDVAAFFAALHGQEVPMADHHPALPEPPRLVGSQDTDLEPLS